MRVGDSNKKAVARRARHHHRVGRIAWWLSLLLALASFVQAEQLPIKTYTTADGLAQNRINRIVRDSHGFLWFCTAEGLSRFDGYTFTNYTTDQGLPDRHVNDLLETGSGVYWVATGDGLCQFNPTGNINPQSAIHNPQSKGPLFVVYHPSEDKAARSVNVLFEDHTGTIWCGTDGGLYRLNQVGGQWGFHFVDIGIPQEPGTLPDMNAILEDRQGALWIGAGSGLYRRWSDGRTERYTIRQGLPSNAVQALLQDRQGQLWVGTKPGLCTLIPEPDLTRTVVARVYTMKDGLPSLDTKSLFQSSDGRLWIGLFGGLSEFIPTAYDDGQTFRTYTMTQGLSAFGIFALAEDREGNLWMGTEEGGAMKMARHGLTSYYEADGLNSARIASVFEDQAGELCAISASADQWSINRFDGKRFTATQPHVPKGIYFGWGWNQITFQDRAGEWWVATGQGLYRFPKVSRVEHLARTRPKAVYTSRNGLVGDDIFRLYEDSRGDIWIATISPVQNGLTRWERATETFHRYSEAGGLLASFVATAFCEDASGHLWIGFSGAGLARYAAGRFTLFTVADGLPEGWIRDLHLDRTGRLWITSSNGGLSRLDDPKAERPRFVVYTTAQGLSSNDVWCITEDKQGRIYIGTGRGLDRLEPATGHIRHYTTADGLARGAVQEAFRDHNGALWFGTDLGLSRLIPEPEEPRSPPPILISGLRIAGVAYPVSELGETEVSQLDLGPNQNQLQIEFVGLGFGLGEALQYQYKLEGADRDWSPLADHHTVNYAGLSPGTYRFVVRAVSRSGVASLAPATVAFTILPPLWQRWWFLTLAAMGVGLVVYAIYRYRVARLLEIERVRTQIATDLHDDIGASLSEVAILSEVIKQRDSGTDPQLVQMLTHIAERARGVIDTMSDIVWSVDPRRDDLNNLVLRIGQLASDLLGAKGIVWDFQTPPELETVKLTPDQRRHVYLIFKEAINNIVRHAECASVWLAIRLTDHRLLAEIRDDGRGFAATRANEEVRPPRQGHGLGNMHARAAQIGGQLRIDSAPGQGTRLILSVPLK